MVHRRPTSEAPLVSKISCDLGHGLLHRLEVKILSEVIVGNGWRIFSAASVDADVLEVFPGHLRNLSIVRST
jgi:hypothetical protein